MKEVMRLKISKSSPFTNLPLYTLSAFSTHPVSLFSEPFSILIPALCSTGRKVISEMPNLFVIAITTLLYVHTEAGFPSQSPRDGKYLQLENFYI